MYIQFFISRSIQDYLLQQLYQNRITFFFYLVYHEMQYIYRSLTPSIAALLLYIHLAQNIG